MKLTPKQKQLVKEYIQRLKSKRPLMEYMPHAPTYVIKSMDDDQFSRMDGLVNIKDMDNFLNSAGSIMSSLASEEGFDSKDVFDFLFLKLVANV